MHRKKTLDFADARGGRNWDSARRKRWGRQSQEVKVRVTGGRKALVFWTVVKWEGDDLS